jgi:hypothetical protein
MTRIIPNLSSGTVDSPGRIPFVWDSRLRENNRLSASNASWQALNAQVEMLLNPNQLSIQQDKRIARSDVRGGTVFYHGVNRTGEDNDILTLAIKGSSGDIRLPTPHPVGALSDPQEDAERERALEENWADTVYLRYVEFWKLVQLSRERILLDDGSRNEFRLSAVGLSYMVVVTFFGFFSKPITWTESANSKGTVEWECEFTVNRIVPDWDDYVRILHGEKDAPDASSRELFRTNEDRRVARIANDDVLEEDA